MKSILLILLAVVIGHSNAYSQKFLKKLQDKVESKVSEKLEEKIDEKIDEEIDKSFDSKKEVNNQQDTSINESYTFSKISSDRTYNFNQSITYTIGNGKEKNLTQMTFLTNDENSYFGIEIESGNETKIIQISDSTKSISLIESSGMKMQTGTSTAMNKVLEKNKQQQITDDSDITKTGNTKEILGYTCYEYVIKTDDGISTAWITEETVFETTQFYQNYSKMKGLMLESTFSNGKKVESTMQAIRINTNAEVSINAAEYKSFGK